MARFHFSLRSFSRADVNAAVVSQRTLRALHLDDASDAPEIVQGPGWFDSSWELVHGLEVREGVPGDGRLDDWLEACVRAELLAAFVVAERHDPPRVREVTPALPRDAFDRFAIDGLELA